MCPNIRCDRNFRKRIENQTGPINIDNAVANSLTDHRSPSSLPQNKRKASYQLVAMKAAGWEQQVQLLVLIPNLHEYPIYDHRFELEFACSLV